jgi:hypothetical protein
MKNFPHFSSNIFLIFLLNFVVKNPKNSHFNVFHTVCKKIVRDQQRKFLWIKTYNWQENYFQSRGNWNFWSRPIFLHNVDAYIFSDRCLKKS